MRYLQDEAAPSAPRMLLGNALRHRRDAIPLTQEEVARQLGCSPSKVSRRESGHHHLKERDLPQLFAVYRIEDPEDQRVLHGLVEVANQATWWQPWATVAQQYLQAVVSFEDMAQRIRSYDCHYLHGLLQTPAYARALIERGRGSRDTHDALVELRKERQARFTAAADKLLICVVHEGALRNPVGSKEIMYEQLDHLIELSRDRRHQIRMAEWGRFDMPVELGTTTIFDFEGLAPKIAYAEAIDGGLIVQDEDLVDRREKAFDALRVRSLAPDATRHRLQHLLSSKIYG
ncbi:helix-turn-helix domain-containing protein [Streptomyces tsukubensis]|nr:helix-turn-helix domain-containing protein [Streptomyces tsukubensis]